MVPNGFIMGLWRRVVLYVSVFCQRTVTDRLQHEIIYSQADNRTEVSLSGEILVTSNSEKIMF